MLLRQKKKKVLFKVGLVLVDNLGEKKAVKVHLCVCDIHTCTHAHRHNQMKIFNVSNKDIKN